MKLNPPASSSDLEVARGLAQRLHHRARGAEVALSPTPVAPAPPAPVPPAPPPEPAASPAPPAVERTDPKLELELEPEPEPPEMEPSEPEVAELAAPELEPEPPEMEPSELEPEVPELAAPEFEPDLEPEPPAVDASEPAELPGLEPDSSEPEPPPPPPEPLFEPEVPMLADEPSPPGPPGHAADTGKFAPEPPDESIVDEDMFERLPPGGYGPATGSFEATSSDGPALSEEGAADEDDALAELTAPPSTSELDDLGAPESGVSPEDLLSEEPAPPEWSDPAALEAEMVGGEEEPQAEAQAASPWDQVADSCLALAPANGAMLVDPAGQVLTSRGDWPEPGPEAIAGRLVSMMEKKLRAAPTRSVSAPLAGQHLTAWRVPATDGYLTVVFMADAPLKADIRPAIDTVIQAAGE